MFEEVMTYQITTMNINLFCLVNRPNYMELVALKLNIIKITINSWVEEIDNLSIDILL